MRHGQYILLLCLTALAGCEKPPLVRYPGEDPVPSPGQAQNTPPVVNAGSDATLTWPTDDSLQLTGSASDDGLPSPASLQYAWRAEPSSVQFDNAMTGSTIARFAAAGTYTLTLTVGDGALQASDSVVVTVSSSAQNTAPVVDAGVDQTIELPFAATLAGSATDDGAPNPTLATTWTAVSGPGTATFANAAAGDTTATFSAVGTYELQLSATDGDLTSVDSILVTVDPAVYPAPDLSDADPNRGWLRVAPAEVQMEAAPLAEAEAYALQASGAGLISRRGRLIHSWGNIDARYDLKSTTKSIGSIALGMALQESRVALEDRASIHLPTVGLPPNTNDPAQLQTITLLQLATHTAGFEKTGRYGQLLAAPGTQWRYSDGGLNWLADTLTTVYAEDLEGLFMTRVYPVLGISRADDIQWRKARSGLRPDPRPNGIEHREFAAGISANVNSLARIGLLFLRRGEWAGGQRLFAPEFADLVRTPRPEAAIATVVEPADFPEANLRYGVLWWTNATGALPNVPHDAYWAWGLGDSLIVVIPSLDLVIARAGTIQPVDPTERTFGEDDWDANYEVLAPFLDPIVRAVIATTP
jgi:CubicO group peptidase (beta-lactamase class C family)